MPFLTTYQVADSSVLEQPFNIDEENGLELINEVDDSIILPPIKKKYNSPIKQDTTTTENTIFYGIKDKGDIPIRNVTHTTNKETLIEKLFNPEPLATSIANWQIIILIGTVLLLGLIKAFSSSRFKLSIKALFTYNVAQEITREEKVFFHRSNILYTIIHLLTTSLFLYQIKEMINSSNTTEKSFVTFLLIFGFLTLVYLLKYIFSKVLFFIFNAVDIAQEYIFNVSLFNNLLGVTLIPILFIIYFSSLSFSLILFIAIPLIGLTLILRLLRLYTIGSTRGVSYVYIFLYICTLEILPLVVLYRIFILK